MVLVEHEIWSTTITLEPLDEVYVVAEYGRAAKLCTRSYVSLSVRVCAGAHTSVITRQHCLNALRGYILWELDCEYSNCCSVLYLMTLPVACRAQHSVIQCYTIETWKGCSRK
jgi:hypothetical protein